MRKHTHISLRDLRSIFLLLGECSELPKIPELWFKHLHEGFIRLFHTMVTTVVVSEASTIVNITPPKPGDLALGYGWLSELDRQKAWKYYSSGGVQDDPVIEQWSRIPGSRATLTRQELADDRAWYGSDSFNNCFRACNTDHMILSRCPLTGGRAMLMNLWRARGEQPFTVRETRLVRLLHREIGRMHSQAITSPHHAAIAALPPRTRQVLSLLLEGSSEKEVARILRISPHSVHDHVKGLHRRLGVSSRGEMLAFVHRTQRHR
jgi:DNA-binding CsgD family transcriptional regulator